MTKMLLFSDSFNASDHWP